jgi:anti-sigma factor RsiW
MDCSEFREKHVAFVDELLSDADRLVMRRHIEECAHCAEHDHSIRRALQLFHNLPSVETSCEFTARLNARLEDLRTKDLARAAYRGPSLTSFMAAAAGVLVVGFVAAAALQWGAPRGELQLTPVVATRAALPSQPIVDHTYLLSASVGTAVWTAALLADRAPQRLMAGNASLAAFRR